MQSTGKCEAQTNAVVLKAYSHVAEAWGLSSREAAGLADLSETTWPEAKPPRFDVDLTKDQLLRLTALIRIFRSLELYCSEPVARAWIRGPNRSPIFAGACPIDSAMEGGLPQMLAIEAYLDALQGGG